MLMTWPGGLGTQLQLTGRCRDLVTRADRSAAAVAGATLDAQVNAAERSFTSLVSDPYLPALEGLVGARGGGRLRHAINELVPEQRDEGTPLYLLLDDLAGSTLIAGFAWLRWVDVIPELAEALEKSAPRPMEGICAGFRPGASSLFPDGTMSGITHNVAPVPPLGGVSDPLAFHQLDPVPDVAMRRARRIDAWVEADEIVVESMFRDSAWEPDGTEVAVHEYSLELRARASTGEVTAVTAVPRVLPYRECRAAAANATLVVGAALPTLRIEVLERIRATDCCTHLNDALRAVAEVPVLVGILQTELGQ